MTWYRKYRPKKIKDLDLDSVREVLLSMMDKGKIPQVLLFAGPKGTGKTSASRIIGAVLNDPANDTVVDQVYFQKKENKKQKLKEPDCDNEIAQKIFEGHSFIVQEMDGASNRGIDDIRMLQDKVMMPPHQGKVAVYILDEVHMLTKEAFNALLKLLEEPPEHAVFVLATTELDKVPSTIVSRCFQIKFHKATDQEIKNRLKKIAKAEKLDIEQGSLDLIIAQADGSFRDAVKLLEFSVQNDKVSFDKVKSLVGADLNSYSQQLIEAIVNKDEQLVVNTFLELRSLNIREKVFYKTLFFYLHQNILDSFKDQQANKVKVQKKVAVYLLKRFLSIDLELYSPINYLSLEINILELIEQAKGKSGSGSGTKVKKKTQIKKKIKQEKQEQKARIETQDISQNKDSLNKETEINSSKVSDSSLSQQVCDRWEELVKYVGQQNMTLAALLRSSKPFPGNNGEATLKVYYKFHAEQLQQPKFMNIVDHCCQNIIGQKVKFKIIHDDKIKKEKSLETESSQDLATAAMENLL